MARMRVFMVFVLAMTAGGALAFGTYNYMSLKDTTFTLETKRAGRYMSQTHASLSVTSKYMRPSSFFGSICTTVREIEAPFRFDDVREHRDDIAIFAVELQLDLGFVPLEIFGAHRARHRCFIGVSVGPPRPSGLRSTGVASRIKPQVRCAFP